MIYNRNQFYISKKDQQTINSFRIILAGCGIGSNIAECALRIGFENLTLIDGDKVELTNLNRQNYLESDVGTPKVDALKKRLLAINHNAKIISENIFLNNENIDMRIAGHDVAINALDFQSDTPFKFDQVCQANKIPVLHPYNIGWATLVFVIFPNSPNLSVISNNYAGFEKKVAAFLIGKLQNGMKSWVQNILSEYEEKGQGESPPQLSVGSWLAGGACTNIIYRIATKQSVKSFPDFYFITAEL
jgi:molybdopterin/thiamine biosynthesis adenylyltransferase